VTRTILCALYVTPVYPKKILPIIILTVGLAVCWLFVTLTFSCHSMASFITCLCILTLKFHP